MTSGERSVYVVRLAELTQPGRVFGHMGRSRAGALKRILGRAEKPVTTGMIAQIMVVSLKKYFRCEVKGDLVKWQTLQ